MFSCTLFVFEVCRDCCGISQRSIYGSEMIKTIGVSVGFVANYVGILEQH